MTALTVRLPNSVLTLDFLKQEAAKGQRSDFDKYLSLVPNVPAQMGDEQV
jgi:hypothetical protein